MKHLLMPGLLTTSLVGLSLLPAQPAKAEKRLQDAGVGAAASVITGKVTHRHHSALSNAINGVAAGAAVNVVNHSHKSRNLGRDAGVGAAAGVVAGTITNNHSVLENAINGAAAGAAVNVTHH